MATWLQFAIVCSSTLLVVQGLKCWHCENANNNLECLSKGWLETCTSNQRHCQNEIRYSFNKRFVKITKRCKQDYGCVTNRKQNQLAPKQYQCEKNNVVNVCWCCCDTDNCNGPAAYCLLDQPKCDAPTPPQHGMVRCQNYNFKIGTNCVMRCRRGYKLKGSSWVTCVRTGYKAIWSYSSSICEPITCNQLPKVPKTGSMTCSDGFNLYSTCRYSCDEGLTLIGSASSTCSHFGKWDRPSPKCVEARCRNVPRRDNLVSSCSKAYNLGSVCTFRCKDGYDIVGSSELVCEGPVVKSFGSWSKSFPRCERTSCPEILESTGRLDCSNGWLIGSVCSFTCAAGKYISSSGGGVVSSDSVFLTRCLDDGTWTETGFFCKNVVCPRLRGPIENGVRTCTGNTVGSTCSYSCIEGYQPEGFSSITCLQSDGNSAVWSHEEPNCVWIPGLLRDCPLPARINQGILICEPFSANNGSHWKEGTTCNLECEAGFGPINRQQSIRCSVGKWDRDLCCSECLPNPSFDVIVLMDSSSGDDTEWEVFKNFVLGFGGYLIRNIGYKIKFTIIPYATVVKEENVITSSVFTTDDEAALFDLTSDISSGGNGISNTGNALKYVIDDVVDKLPNIRVPIIYILSNNSPSDQKVAVENAMILKNKGIQTKIVPLNADFSANPGGNRLAFDALTDGEDDSVVDSTGTTRDQFYPLVARRLDEFSQSYCNYPFQTCV